MRQRPPSRRGFYAGPISRLVAFAADIAALWGIFLLTTWGIAMAINLITGHTLTIHRSRWYLIVALVVWGFVYFAYQWTLGGQSLGMALVGIRVSNLQGGAITRRQAAIRTLVLPVSFALLGLGFLGLVFGRQRRAIHDVAAGTTVVIAWDAAVGRLPWLRGFNDDAETTPAA